MTPRLADLRSCFEGAVPSVFATCSPDGTPNVAYLSQVHYVDDAHVALTYQFFNTTRKNILANPRGVVQVVDPDTAGHFRLHLQYLRTETEGSLFEKMKAKLAGIASHTGISKVFRLRGSDVYKVLKIEQVFGKPATDASQGQRLLSALRTCLTEVGQSSDLGRLFDEALQGWSATSTSATRCCSCTIRGAASSTPSLPAAIRSPAWAPRSVQGKELSACST